jgi:hypothetical protein
MMTTTKLYARAGATAIAAVMALSPTYAASPKPVIDLSKSPALTQEAGAVPPSQAAPKTAQAGVDERTLELGGGVIAILALGGAAIAMRSRKRRREEEKSWQDSDHAATEPASAPADAGRSAFAWGGETPRAATTDRRRSGETWVERAYRGPSAENPSLSLKKRLKRAAFFDKREREAARGEAAPVDADAGLPDAVAEERQLEAA